MQEFLSSEINFVPLLIGITIVPIIYFIGYIVKEDGRASMKENPLIFFYFVFIFGFFYVYWAEPQILSEYFHISDVMQAIIYGAIAFSPMIGKELPN